MSLTFIDVAHSNQRPSLRTNQIYNMKINIYFKFNLLGKNRKIFFAGYENRLFEGRMERGMEY
jgi:hypothetical protein